MPFGDVGRLRGFRKSRTSSGFPHISVIDATALMSQTDCLNFQHLFSNVAAPTNRFYRQSLNLLTT